MLEEFIEKTHKIIDTLAHQAYYARKLTHSLLKQIIMRNSISIKFFLIKGLVLLFVGITQSNIFAQTDADRFAEGRVALDKYKDCSAAIKALEQVSPQGRQEPLWMYYMARAKECVGNLEEALDYYQKYSNAVPNSQPQVSEKIGELRYLVTKKKDEEALAKKKQEERRKADEESRKSQQEYNLSKGVTFERLKANLPAQDFEEYSRSPEYSMRMSQYIIDSSNYCDFKISYNSSSASQWESLFSGKQKNCSKEIVFSLAEIDFSQLKVTKYNPRPESKTEAPLFPPFVSEFTSFSRNYFTTTYWGLELFTKENKQNISLLGSKDNDCKFSPKTDRIILYFKTKEAAEKFFNDLKHLSTFCQN